jgi:membrane protease YdiL (CAAX protease family)
MRYLQMRKYSFLDLWVRVIIFFTICIVLIFNFQVFILPLARTWFNNGENFPVTLELNLVRTMNGIVGVGLVYVFLKFDRQKLNVIGMSWNHKWGNEWILISIPITIAGLIPTVIIELIFGIVIFSELLDILGIILTFLVTMFAIGLGEEILFRGYIQTLLETEYSFEYSALISAFMFGLLHLWLAATSRNIFHMISILFSAFVIGITFSYAYRITKYNLIFPVAIHGFWDFFLFIFQAEFFYEDWLHVIMEIIASTIGAAIILALVHFYATKRMNFMTLEATSKE